MQRLAFLNLIAKNRSATFTLTTDTTAASTNWTLGTLPQPAANISIKEGTQLKASPLGQRQGKLYAMTIMQKGLKNRVIWVNFSSLKAN